MLGSDSGPGRESDTAFIVKNQSFYTFDYVDQEVLRHFHVTEAYYTHPVTPKMGFRKTASPRQTNEHFGVDKDVHGIWL